MAHKSHPMAACMHLKQCELSILCFNPGLLYKATAWLMMCSDLSPLTELFMLLVVLLYM